MFALLVVYEMKHTKQTCTKKKQTIVIEEASKTNSYIALDMVRREYHHPISLDIDRNPSRRFSLGVIAHVDSRAVIV